MCGAKFHVVKNKMTKEEANPEWGEYQRIALCVISMNSFIHQDRFNTLSFTLSTPSVFGITGCFINVVLGRH